MKLNKTEKEILQETKCTIYWWNFRKKTLDINDTLENVLKSKKIILTKTQDNEFFKEIYTYRISFSVGSESVVIKRRGNEFGLVDFALNALSYYLIYLGDKAQIETFGKYGRFKSINY